ncbi:MAG: hypothetical protein M1820_004445 [Bogoriella megaspora]|nr:MAG: hypothetical protein M1820_004445 [Bogoriella megaspora]
MSGGWFTTFLNCRLCINGELVEDQFVVSDEVCNNPVDWKNTQEDWIYWRVIRQDLEDGIIAPGFLELQTNGVLGFHFTHFENEHKYENELKKVAKYYASQGVTGFWGTIPTVSSDNFKKILPALHPRDFPESASLLGAHAEGPYLHPSKAGAHNASLFHAPSSSPISNVYGSDLSSLKLVTIAPELDGSNNLIHELTQSGIKVSLGHSSATYNTGLSALSSGATSLTHTLNAMPLLSHRAPTLASLISPTSPSFPSSTSTSSLPNPTPPFYSLIADGHHLHPAIVSLLYRANPSKCILVTDSIELAGLDDGVYPGHAQVEGKQVKEGGRVVIEGTDTLIGSCASLQECVRNLMAYSGCTLAQAVKCATENVADMMGDKERGRLEEGRRADFVVLSDEGEVLQTWVAGVKVWEKGQ